MALEVTRSVTLTGKCIINGTTVENYTASINEQKPEGMTITRSILNNALRRENRSACITDQVAFEDAAYAMQTEMMKEE